MAKLKDTTITGGLEVSGEVTILSPTASNNPATKKYVDDIIFNLPTTLTISPSNFESQTAKTFLAAPNDEDGDPTFREIIAADIPILNQDTTGNAETATKLATARTFTITDNDATNSQASATNFDGSNNFTIKLPATIKASLTGTATNVTGTVAIANGGTGQTNAISAFKALSPMTTTGDMIYAGGDFAIGTRLGGNMSATRKFLLSVGNGIKAAEPSWDTVTKTDVGLSNVDNTSDANKPVSTATQTALSSKANSASPELTGTPLSVTATKGTNTTQIATTAFVQTAVGDYVAKNTAITGATKTKITYDSKGLVTAGADASLDDIPDGLTRKLSNYVPTTRTVNGQALNSDVSLDLENLNNIANEDPATAGQFLVNDGQGLWVPTTIDYVPTTRKVNDKALSSDITLSLDDVNDGSVRKLSDYVAKNNAITGATKIKITYDAKGLVTAGADASLSDLSDVYFDAPPAVGNLLRYNGEEWAPASASGTYAGPTETYLGGRTSSGDISVVDIDNFDEIIIELYTFHTYFWDQSETDTSTDFFVTRTILPHNKFAHYHKQWRDDSNNIGATLTTVNMYSNDIISVHVDRINAAGTTLNIFFRGTLSGTYAGTPWGAGVRIYGRNW